jgi:alkaline phosphatase
MLKFFLKILVPASISIALPQRQSKLMPENWSYPVQSPDEATRDFWYDSGQQQLRDQIAQNLNKKVAKNLIIIVADGMSISTQTATRIYMGGEELSLSFEKFPHCGLAKTYCVNFQVPDSACSATAFLSGIKTNLGVLSMDANTAFNNCSKSDESHVHSIFKYAQNAGKATGIVTNTRITDATPAGF